MLSKILTTTVMGMDASLITVETNISRGLPCYNVVGLGRYCHKRSGKQDKGGNSQLRHGIPHDQDRCEFGTGVFKKRRKPF